LKIALFGTDFRKYQIVYQDVNKYKNRITTPNTGKPSFTLNEHVPKSDNPEFLDRKTSKITPTVRPPHTRWKIFYGIFYPLRLFLMTKIT